MQIFKWFQLWKDWINECHIPLTCFWQLLDYDYHLFQIYLLKFFKLFLSFLLFGLLLHLEHLLLEFKFKILYHISDTCLLLLLLIHCFLILLGLQFNILCWRSYSKILKFLHYWLIHLLIFNSLLIMTRYIPLTYVVLV